MLELIKELCSELEDLIMEKSLLVGIAPESMVEVQLNPEYDDDDSIKCVIVIGCTQPETLDEDQSEQISDIVNDFVNEIYDDFQYVEYYPVTLSEV